MDSDDTSCRRAGDIKGRLCCWMLSIEKPAMKRNANHCFKIEIERVQFRQIGESIEGSFRLVFSFFEKVDYRLDALFGENASRPIHHEPRAGMKPNIAWEGYCHRISFPSAGPAARPCCYFWKQQATESRR